MQKFELYKSQIGRFVSGERFEAQEEYIQQWGIKSGRFGEQLIQEMLGEDYTTSRSDCRIPHGSSYYDADGYIKSLDIYLESKFLTFWSAGTAPEKLPYFLFKAEHYDKPVVLVLGGEHELLKDPPSRTLWTAFNHPEQCDSKAALAVIQAVGDRLAGIVKLSELPEWIRARQASR